MLPCVFSYIFTISKNVWGRYRDISDTRTLSPKQFVCDEPSFQKLLEFIFELHAKWVICWTTKCAWWHLVVTTNTKFHLNLLSSFGSETCWQTDKRTRLPYHLFVLGTLFKKCIIGLSGWYKLPSTFRNNQMCVSWNKLLLSLSLFRTDTHVCMYMCQALPNKICGLS
jgi:hypothetical protein